MIIKNRIQFITALVVGVILFGCNDQKPQQVATAISSDPRRFTVSRESYVNLETAGSSVDQQKHEIFIITDTSTGAQYLGVESVGLCALQSAPAPSVGPVIAPPTQPVEK